MKFTLNEDTMFGDTLVKVGSVIDYQSLQITPKGSVEDQEEETENVKTAQKLMTKSIENKIPPLYDQDGKGKDAIVYVKFFTPWSNWTWYVTEYDPKQKLLFGYVVGTHPEFGYFSLTELESVTGPGGLKIERDINFRPRKLRELI